MDEKPATLKLSLPENQIYLFFPLLQRGIHVPAKVGCDIQSLLCDQFGFMPEYLKDRINTIFLDGKPVDEVKTAMVKDGATLALSAAMPGLVGATFRKAGCLASFRGTITYQGDEEGGTCHDGRITLKLFNLLLKEMGPHALEHGILLDGRALKLLFETLEGEMGDLFNQIPAEEGYLTAERIARKDWIANGKTYFLKVTCHS